MNSELEKLRKITEALTSNGYLIDQTKEWEYAFNAVPDNIFVINPKFEVKFVNKALIRKLKKKKEAIIGIPCYAMLGFDKPILDACEDPADQCAKCFNRDECEDHNGDVCNFGEHLIPSLEGAFEFTRSAIKTDTDKLLGYICVLRDVTEARMISKSTQSLLKLHTIDCKDDERLARFILEEVVQLTDSEVGYLHFVKGHGSGDLRLDLFIWSQGTMKSCKAEAAMHYPLCDAGIWADSVREGKPIIHNDYTNEPTAKGLPEGHFPLIRHMSVPVFDDGVIVAVAGVGNKLIPYTDLDVSQTTITLAAMWTAMTKMQAQRKIAEYEHSLSELTRLTRTAIYEIDFELNKFTYVNDAMCDHTGYTRDELLNMGPSELLTERSQEQWMARFEAFHRGENVASSVEYQAKTKDGSLVWVLCSTDFRTRDGNIVGARVIAIDITKQRDVETKVKNIMESSPFGVHMYNYIDDDLIFIGSNPAADKILAVDNRQFVGLPLRKAFPDLENHNVPDKYIEVMQTGETWSALIDYTDDKIGGSFEVHAFKTSENSMAAMFKEVGVEQVLQEKVIELTEQLHDAEDECRVLAEYLAVGKLIDQPLSIHENRFKRLFQTSPMCMGVVSYPDYRVVWANTSMCKMMGYEESELVGQSISIAHKEHASFEKVVAYINKEVTEKGIATLSFDVINKAGETINILFNVALLNGDVNRLSFSFINIDDNYARIE